jgi:hypothetical protein
MVTLGDIPKNHTKTHTTEMSSMHAWQSQKVPWRLKGRDGKSKIKAASIPSDIVSIDPLESQIPGMMAQMKGIPTKRDIKL